MNTDKGRFTIDFFEFSFLVEACIPPRPIARAMFWENVINHYYRIMKPDERRRLYEWITKNWQFEEGMKNGNKDCLLFEARFNPDNQWDVITDDGETERGSKCFLFEGRYHVNKNTWLDEKFIISKIKTNE